MKSPTGNQFWQKLVDWRGASLRVGMKIDSMHLAKAHQLETSQSSRWKEGVFDVSDRRSNGPDHPSKDLQRTSKQNEPTMKIQLPNITTREIGFHNHLWARQTAEH